MARPTLKRLSAVPARETPPPVVRRSGNGPLFCGARMRSIQAQLKQLAASDVPVVLQGETGAGKEVVAREIHALSARALQPFLKLNCAAVPLELLESELFGYDRGAFTGALGSKLGKFEFADGGTILLDEIGDMDVKLQAKLLHVLQDSAFQRLGGTETIHVDVRVLTTTHRDLRQEIAAGRFREDLYFRLNVVTIFVPPLRERKDEILALAKFFLEKHAVPGTPVPELSREMRSTLLGYKWPGNVRELENVMRKLLVFGDQGLVLDQLGPEPANGHSQGREIATSVEELSPDGDNGEPLATLTQVNRARDKAEVAAIRAALSRSRWNRREAAALLNIDYKALLYRMKKLGLDDNRRDNPGGKE